MWNSKLVLALAFGCIHVGKKSCVLAAKTIEVGTYEELRNALDSCESGKSQRVCSLETRRVYTYATQ